MSARLVRAAPDMAAERRRAAALDRRHDLAGSTGRGNTFRELFCWGLIEQGLSGPFIELVECLSANAAVMRTEALAHKPGHVFEL